MVDAGHEDLEVAAELSCGPEPLGFLFTVDGMIVTVDKGSWAERHGVQVGDQILAISGFSMEKFLQKNPTARSRMSLMGPQRVVLRLKAEKGHVKEAIRTVQSKPITHQRADFRRALQEESQRFSFREALQKELLHWRPRDTWPFPGLAASSVDAVVEVNQLCFGHDESTQSGRRPARIKEMEAAARKLQSLFRWRKLWQQLDTSQERAEAATKIQSMQRGRQIRRGVAAQFAAFHEDHTKSDTSMVGSEGSEGQADHVGADLPRTLGDVAEPPAQHNKPRAEEPEVTARGVDLKKSTSSEEPVEVQRGGHSVVEQEVPRVQLHRASGASAAPEPRAPKVTNFFDAPDPVLEAAATRIQAAERGRQSRKKRPAPSFSAGPISPTGPAAEETAEGQWNSVPPLTVEESTDWLGSPESASWNGEEQERGHQPIDAMTSPDDTGEIVDTSSVKKDDEPGKDHIFQVRTEVAPADPSLQPATESDSFKIEPVKFDQAKSTAVQPESLQSPRRQTSQGSDEAPINTMDFLSEEAAVAVPQQRLQLPKPKKSPRQRPDRIGPIIPKPQPKAPTTPASDSSAWLIDLSSSGELQDPAKGAAADALGPSPRGRVQPQGFRIPKEKEKEKESDSKRKKKKKDRKDRKDEEVDLDSFGFQLF
ncbi:unnamed protein product [Durusdinium trenchii]|uniref:PDZ domain-containing protein n=1 Tax=Durusdinium trenchii TaxID=1381693 RepID=A0ABP0T1A7_9DINO